MLDRIRVAVSPLIDSLAISPSRIVRVFALQWGYGTVDRPNIFNARVGRGGDQSLYMNGLLFIRIMLPFFIGIQIRWGGATTRRAYLQTHFGWKLNGEFGVAFRIQSDASAATGTTGHNYGQAQGYADGTK